MNLSKYADPPPPPTAGNVDAQEAQMIQPHQQSSKPTTSPTTLKPVIPAPDQAIHPPLDGSLDEFAQTRPPDDLFADDFEPIEESATTESVTVPVNQSDLAKEPILPPRGGKGRGRGSRRGIPQRTPESNSQTKATASPGDGDKTESGPVQTRTEAVRGDRSGTGGIKKAKLTEEELSAKMEEIKLKNQSLEAAHARAEADEAHFKEREAQAQEKRRLERVNRQHMMGEREKNRLRKLNALQGREWDVQKDATQDATDGHPGRSQFRRGAYGAVANDERHSINQEEKDIEPAYREHDYNGRGGNRGRGRGRGRGRPRGGLGGPNPYENPVEKVPPARQQNPPNVSDFPALPAAASSNASAPTKSGEGTSTSYSPTQAGSSAPEQGSSWAEEMENQTTAWKT